MFYNSEIVYLYEIGWDWVIEVCVVYLYIFCFEIIQICLLFQGCRLLFYQIYNKCLKYNMIVYFIKLIFFFNLSFEYVRLYEILRKVMMFEFNFYDVLLNINKICYKIFLIDD